MSYPDNLSLTKNDVIDENTYADIQLNSKDVSFEGEEVVE